jgi:hypothetical protein
MLIRELTADPSTGLDARIADRVFAAGPPREE